MYFELLTFSWQPTMRLPFSAIVYMLLEKFVFILVILQHVQLDRIENESDASKTEASEIESSETEASETNAGETNAKHSQ